MATSPFSFIDRFPLSSFPSGVKKSLVITGTLSRVHFVHADMETRSVDAPVHEPTSHTIFCAGRLLDFADLHAFQLVLLHDQAPHDFSISSVEEIRLPHPADA
jgi:hypothetical protein